MQQPNDRITQLNTQINTYIDDLARLTDEARVSAAMQAYLDTCARFHKYSPTNQLLIRLTRPDATRVAGYHAWKKLGRCVLKGEKGIPIFAPLLVRADDGSGERVLRGFKVVYVFDLAQTDGKPLPPAPDWSSPARNAQLSARLLAFADQQGIDVRFGELPGNTQGVSRNGKIVISPQAGTATLIHELAHELLHWREHTFSRLVVETEAEAVAYVVARHFGLDNTGSPNYLALWDADSDVIYVHLERISECARKVIGAIEGAPQAEAAS